MSRWQMVCSGLLGLCLAACGGEGAAIDSPAPDQSAAQLGRVEPGRGKPHCKSCGEPKLHVQVKSETGDDICVYDDGKGEARLDFGVKNEGSDLLQHILVYDKHDDDSRKLVCLKTHDTCELRDDTRENRRDCQFELSAGDNWGCELDRTLERSSKPDEDHVWATAENECGEKAKAEAQLRINTKKCERDDDEDCDDDDHGDDDSACGCPVVCAPSDGVVGPRTTDGTDDSDGNSNGCELMTCCSCPVVPADGATGPLGPTQDGTGGSDGDTCCLPAACCGPRDGFPDGGVVLSDVVSGGCGVQLSTSIDGSDGNACCQVVTCCSTDGASDSNGVLRGPVTDGSGGCASCCPMPAPDGSDGDGIEVHGISLRHEGEHHHCRKHHPKHHCCRRVVCCPPSTTGSSSGSSGSSGDSGTLVTTGTTGSTGEGATTGTTGSSGSTGTTGTTGSSGSTGEGSSSGSSGSTGELELSATPSMDALCPSAGGTVDTVITATNHTGGTLSDVLVRETLTNQSSGQLPYIEYALVCLDTDGIHCTLADDDATHQALCAVTLADGDAFSCTQHEEFSTSLVSQTETYSASGVDSSQNTVNSTPPATTVDIEQSQLFCPP